MRRRNMVTRHSLSVVFLWCALPCLVLAGPPPLFEQGAILTLHRAIESALTHHPARLAAQSRVGGPEPDRFASRTRSGRETLRERSWEHH